MSCPYASPLPHLHCPEARENKINNVWAHGKPDLGLLTFKTKAINLLLILGMKKEAGDKKQVFFLDRALLLGWLLAHKKLIHLHEGSHSLSVK